MSVTVSLINEEMSIFCVQFESSEVRYVLVIVHFLLSRHVHLFWLIH